ncbi:MAG: alpha/beta hydrolase, partial [Alteraurantiacibacter sp.]
MSSRSQLVKFPALSGVAGAALALSGCAATNDFQSTATEAALVATGQVSARSASAPPPPVPDTAQTTPPKPSADMQAVLEALAALGGEPLTSLTPAQARMQPTFADAYARVAQQRGIALKTGAVTTTDYSYGSDDKQFVRVYRPAGTTADADLPVIVYYHGGGWVIANVDVYDATPRYLAEAMNAVVVSAEYRHAPE